jgi:hypothetical protein
MHASLLGCCRCSNVYHLTTSASQLEAAGAPSLEKDGYNPYSPSGYRNYTMTMYWQRDNGYLPSVWTAQGAAKLTVTEATAAGRTVLACDKRHGSAWLSIAWDVSS